MESKIYINNKIDSSENDKCNCDKMFICADMQLWYTKQVADIENCVIECPWSLKSIDEICKSKNAICRVCLDGDNVVGYYTLYDVCDEGCVNNIAVLKSRQGVGLGNILMQDMIYCAKKNGVIALTLEVNINNIKAIKLYEKFGFVTEGVRKKFYNDNEDALIMWLRKL